MALSKHTRVRLIRRDGKRVRAHRWLMEQRLGRQLLPDEHVHHRDGNPLNNDLSKKSCIRDMQAEAIAVLTKHGIVPRGKPVDTR